MSKRKRADNEVVPVHVKKENLSWTPQMDAADNEVVYVPVKKENLSWTPKMDAALIEALLVEQDKGHRVGGTFLTLAYTNVHATMQAQFKDITITKDNIHNRMKTVNFFLLNVMICSGELHSVGSLGILVPNSLRLNQKYGTT